MRVIQEQLHFWPLAWRRNHLSMRTYDHNSWRNYNQQKSYKIYDCTHTHIHTCTHIGTLAQHMQKESICFLLLVKKGCNPIQLSGSVAADAVAAIEAVGWGAVRAWQSNPHLEPCLCISPIFIRFNLVFGTVACFVSNAFKFLLLKFMSAKVIFLIVFPGESLRVFFCSVFCFYAGLGCRLSSGVDSNGKQASYRNWQLFFSLLVRLWHLCCRNFLPGVSLSLTLSLSDTLSLSLSHVFCNMCEAHHMQISVRVFEVEFVLSLGFCLI